MSNLSERVNGIAAKDRPFILIGVMSVFIVVFCVPAVMMILINPDAWNIWTTLWFSVPMFLAFRIIYAGHEDEASGFKAFFEIMKRLKIITGLGVLVLIGFDLPDTVSFLITGFCYCSTLMAIEKHLKEYYAFGKKWTLKFVSFIKDKIEIIQENTEKMEVKVMSWFRKKKESVSVNSFFQDLNKTLKETEFMKVNYENIVYCTQQLFSKHTELPADVLEDYKHAAEFAKEKGFDVVVDLTNSTGEQGKIFAELGIHYHSVGVPADAAIVSDGISHTEAAYPCRVPAFHNKKVLAISRDYMGKESDDYEELSNQFDNILVMGDQETHKEMHYAFANAASVENDSEDEDRKNLWAWYAI